MKILNDSDYWYCEECDDMNKVNIIIYDDGYFTVECEICDNLLQIGVKG